MSRNYTEFEVEWLKKNYSTATPIEVEIAMNRSFNTVGAKARRMGIKRPLTVRYVTRKPRSKHQPTAHIEITKDEQEQRFHNLLCLLVRCKKNTKLKTSDVVDKVLSQVALGNISID